MKKMPQSPSSRRAVVKLLLGALGAAAVPVTGWSAPARADGTSRPQGTAAKSALQYQDHPKGTSACARCVNFVPGRTPDAPGRCVIVAGDISPRGWCLAYADKG